MKSPLRYRNGARLNGALQRDYMVVLPRNGIADVLGFARQVKSGLTHVFRTRVGHRAGSLRDQQVEQLLLQPNQLDLAGDVFAIDPGQPVAADNLGKVAVELETSSDELLSEVEWITRLVRANKELPAINEKLNSVFWVGAV